MVNYFSNSFVAKYKGINFFTEFNYFSIQYVTIPYFTEFVAF